MKIVVTHFNGTRELLTLVPPFIVTSSDLFHVLHCGDGTDHYFYADERRQGYYDGWGRGCSLSAGDDGIALAKQISCQRESAPPLETEEEKNTDQKL